MDDEAAILEVVAERGPVSAQEVAEAVGCSLRAADLRLRELYIDGKLEPQSVGNTLLWRIANGVDDVRGEHAPSH